MEIARAANRLAALSSDEDTEDDGEPSSGPTAQTAETEAEELLIEKKRAVKRKFTEEMLIGPCGLDRLYETFPKKCRMRGRGYEASDLNRLMCLYNEWAYQLFPGCHQGDLLDAVAKMGSKPAIKAHMNRLRDTERNRYIVEVLKMDLPAERSASPSGMTSPEDNNTPNTMFGTPSEPPVQVDMPDFGEACLLALNAAMANKRKETLAKNDSELDQTNIPAAAGSVSASSASILGVPCPEISFEPDQLSGGVNISGDVVEMSDDEVELDFDELDAI